MAYAKRLKGSEVEQVRDDLTSEVTRLGSKVAQDVFGNNARHPDMASLASAELDQMYRQAYLKNDRDWLMQEAQRDPIQFLDVTDRIGVPDPPVDMKGEPVGVSPDALRNMTPIPPQAPPMGPAVPPALPAPMPPAAAAVLAAPPLPGAVSPASQVSAQLPLPGMT